MTHADDTFCYGIVFLRGDGRIVLCGRIEVVPDVVPTTAAAGYPDRRDDH